MSWPGLQAYDALVLWCSGALLLRSPAGLVSAQGARSDRKVAVRRPDRSAHAIPGVGRFPLLTALPVLQADALSESKKSTPVLSQKTSHRKHLSLDFGETFRWLRSGLSAQDRGMIAPEYLDPPDGILKIALKVSVSGKPSDGCGAACPRRTAGWSSRSISINQTTFCRQQQVRPPAYQFWFCR